MIGESNETTPEILTTAFEQLVQSSGRLLEQTAVRRAVHEAVTAQPGPVRSQWSHWFLDAGQSLGLTINALSTPIETSIDLADCGMTLLTWHDPSGRFLVIARGDRGEVVDFWSDSPDAKTRSSLARLTELIIEGEREKPIDWIAVQSTHFKYDSDSHPTHPTPVVRLWRMLRPEMNDIWVLLVLALVIGILATAVPLAGQQLVRTVTFGTLYQPIVVLTLLLLLFLGFRGALQALNVFVVELIQQRLFARTVAELSLRLLKSDYMALRQANGPELVNRFLDIATVQKVVAGLLVDGLALLLTTVIGMTLLAFYHPFLLGYDILLLAMLLLIVLLLGRGGTQTAIRESFEKYRVAAWLEEFARCPLAFRLAGGADFAFARADRLTSEYLIARRIHFRVLLRQILSLFAIQALASTTLLGLGGYLVMNEQLSLGQLVAAELIVTMIVGSFAKLSKHIEGYFDLMAAMNKLGHIADLPSERGGRSMSLLPNTPLVEIRQKRFVAWSDEAKRDSPHLGKVTSLCLETSQHVAVFGESGTGKSYLSDMLYGLHSSAEGLAMLGGNPVRELSPTVLRRHIALIRDVEILAATIEENVHLGRTEVDASVIREALSIAGLDNELAALPDGVLTELTCDGLPLSDSQRVRLMIARAVAGGPKLLVIDGLLDRLPDDLLDPLLTNLQARHSPSTLLIFTGRQDLAQRVPRVLKLVSYHGAATTDGSHQQNGHKH